MIARIKFQFPFLVKGILDSLPSWVWTSESTTFLDPSMGGGQFVKEIEHRLREAGHSDENIKNRVYGFESMQTRVNFAIIKHNLVGTYMVLDFLSWESNMKFDVIVGNPPYQGGLSMHQQFFNKAVESVVDGGVVCFIQPATAYFNKKANKKSPEKTMIDNIKKYETSVKFYDGSTTFNGTMIFTDIAFTILKKNSTQNRYLKEVSYKNGIVYRKVDIDNINILEIDPTTYQNIRDKYFSFLEKMGSVHDIVDYSNESTGMMIPGIRANFPRIDAISIITKSEENRDKTGMTVCIEKSQEKSFNSYAESFVARMGLMLSKFNQHNDRGELKTVPLVPFDRIWGDEELARLIGLTDEELNLIRSILPDYHGLLKNVE